MRLFIFVSAICVAFSTHLRATGDDAAANIAKKQTELDDAIQKLKEYQDQLRSIVGELDGPFTTTDMKNIKGPDVSQKSVNLANASSPKAQNARSIIMLFPTQEAESD